VREGIERGNVADYEAGTFFFERQGKRGKKAKLRRGRRPKAERAGAKEKERGRRNCRAA
jgi:hypothetical protein